MRPLFKTHGGKYYLNRRINAQLPPHLTYVEPFAGGLSVLLNSPEALYEYAYDIDSDLIHCYNELIANPKGFIDHLWSIPYCREWFEWALQPTENSASRAIRYLVRNRFSRGGLGK